MTSVKEIYVNFLGDDVIYGPNPGQSTATKEMKIKWKRMASTVENLLVDFGIDPENANIERHDSFMSVALEGEVTFELEISIRDFEKLFQRPCVQPIIDFLNRKQKVYTIDSLYGHCMNNNNKKDL